MLPGAYTLVDGFFAPNMRASYFDLKKSGRGGP